MADGGASTFILLITGLLISSSVSALLITEWSNAAKVAQVQQRGVQLQAEVDIDFSGDPMMVDLDLITSPEEITFYVQNTGIHTMDESTLGVFIDGSTPAGISISFAGTPTPTTWEPNGLLIVVLEDANFATDYSEGDDVSLFVIASSETVNGLSSSANFNVEVRLS